MKNVSGKVVTIGDNISATIILNPKFYGEPAEAITPSLAFASESGMDLPGEDKIILVTGRNFGYGTVNESVLMAVQKAGVQAIIGTEFPYYVYRNGLNLGLPVFVSDSAADNCSDGDDVSIDLESGKVTNNSNGQEFQTRDRPDFIRRLMEMGGVTVFIQSIREQEEDGA